MYMFITFSGLLVIMFPFLIQEVSSAHHMMYLRSAFDGKNRMLPVHERYLRIKNLTAAAALKCWKCIAHNCDTTPESNYKASRTTCSDKAACMKVRYRMFDNFTHYDSVIRTCSTGICQPTTELAFSTCVEKKNYMIRGCVLRKCCSDQDFCNTGDRITAITALLLFLHIIYACIT